MTLLASNGEEWVLSPAIVAIPIGLGLLRGTPGWRYVALVWCVLACLLSSQRIYSLIGSTRAMGLLGDPTIAGYVALETLALVLLIFAAAWAFHGLRTVREPSRLPASRTHEMASAIPRFLFTACSMGLAVMTGGMGTLSTRIGPESKLRSASGEEALRDLPVLLPLTLEVLGGEEPAIIRYVWYSEFKGTPVGSHVANLGVFFRRAGAWSSSQGWHHNPNRFVLDFQVKKVSLAFGWPLIKRGNAQYAAKLRGMGRYEGFEATLDFQQRFNIEGTTTVRKQRVLFQEAIERDALRALRKAARQANRDDLEREWRARPLKRDELESLVRARLDRGNGHLRAGLTATAVREYASAVHALECWIHWAESYDTPASVRYLEGNGFSLAEARSYVRTEVSKAKGKLAQTLSDVGSKLLDDDAIDPEVRLLALDHFRRVCELTEWKEAYQVESLAWAYARVWGYVERDRPPGQPRYWMACAAVRAASSEHCLTGPDAVNRLGEPSRRAAERTALRNQARALLKAEAEQPQSLLVAHGNERLAVIVKTFSWWMEDPELAAVRNAEALAKLPEGERKAWEALWADVAGQLERARGAAPTGTDELPANPFAR